MTAMVLLMAAVFLAASVEAIEAMTVVLAAGAAQGYRRPVLGALCAVLVLGVFVAAGGLPLLHWVPLRILRIVMGAGMLYVGQKWIRKAVLRASGRKALHSEDATYRETEGKLSSGASGFRLSFGATMLEGSEVLLIVAGLGIGSHHLLQAGIAAIVACCIIAAIGCAVAKPLARAPENSMKMATAVALLALGAFYFGEGAGVPWPGADAMILALVAIISLGAWFAVRRLRVAPQEAKVVA